MSFPLYTPLPPFAAFDDSQPFIDPYATQVATTLHVLNRRYRSLSLHANCEAQEVDRFQAQLERARDWRSQAPSRNKARGRWPFLTLAKRQLDAAKLRHTIVSSDLQTCVAELDYWNDVQNSLRVPWYPGMQYDNETYRPWNTMPVEKAMYIPSKRADPETLTAGAKVLLDMIKGKDETVKDMQQSKAPSGEMYVLANWTGVKRPSVIAGIVEDTGDLLAPPSLPARSKSI